MRGRTFSWNFKTGQAQPVNGVGMWARCDPLALCDALSAAMAWIAFRYAADDGRACHRFFGDS